MSETTESDMIIIMHRLKRLIGSSYHQKRIDIIITHNAHYVQSDGAWKQKNVVITPYSAATFSRYPRPVPQATQSGRVAHQATTV